MPIFAPIFMESIIKSFQPISLDEMSGIKLMNRTDTKFVTTVDRLKLLLMLAKDDYRIQENEGIRNANYYTAYWIKGYAVDTALVFPVAQPIAYNSNYKCTLSVYWGEKESSTKNPLIAGGCPYGTIRILT